MSDKTITSSNAVIYLSIPDVYSIPQKLQGFAVDNVFDSDDIQHVEVRMGVDGHLSAGKVYNPIPVNIALQPDSDSIEVFQNWIAAQNTEGEVIKGSMTVTLSATGTKYTCNRGFLTNGKMMPDGKKVLEPITYKITFESVDVDNI